LHAPKEEITSPAWETTAAGTGNRNMNRRVLNGTESMEGPTRRGKFMQRRRQRINQKKKSPTTAESKA